jgi:hypothetical protein
MPRKRAQPAPDRSSSAITMRIYRPTDGYDMPGSDYLPEGPEVAPCFVNRIPCNLRDWTAKEWARLPAGLRPSNAFPGNRGSWYAIDPDD